MLREETSRIRRSTSSSAASARRVSPRPSTAALSADVAADPSAAPPRAPAAREGSPRARQRARSDDPLGTACRQAASASCHRPVDPLPKGGEGERFGHVRQPHPLDGSPGRATACGPGCPGAWPARSRTTTCTGASACPWGSSRPRPSGRGRRRSPAARRTRRSRQGTPCRGCMPGLLEERPPAVRAQAREPEIEACRVDGSAAQETRQVPGRCRD